MNPAEDFIKRALPQLSNADYLNLTQHFQTLGVGSADDFLELTHEDVAQHLKLVQFRKLMTYCKNG